MPSLDDLIKLGTLAVTIGVNSVPPFFGTKLLPFLNPAIVEDVWGPTIIAMPVAGGAFYVLSLPRQERSPRSWPVALAAFIFVASVALLFALTGDILQVTPKLAAYLARLLVVALFFGAGGVIGSVMARVPPMFSGAKAA